MQPCINKNLEVFYLQKCKFPHLINSTLQGKLYFTLSVDVCESECSCVHYQILWGHVGWPTTSKGSSRLRSVFKVEVSSHGKW